MCLFYGQATTKIKTLHYVSYSQCLSPSTLPFQQHFCDPGRESNEISIAELTTHACIKSAKENKKQTIFFRKVSKS